MFAGMLRYADKLIGDVVAELTRLGLRDNTVVFVASDNGTEKRFSARRNGRNVQGDLYSLSEAGGNVVLLANSPKLVPGGRTLPLADFTDIYPTVCELAGIPVPHAHKPDGKSFAGFLRGRPGAMPHRTWMSTNITRTRVVRDERFKLYSDGRLFDANADPAEQHDLAATRDPIALAVRQRLEQVLASLPPDAPPPFPLRSLSAFKLHGEAQRSRSNCCHETQTASPPPEFWRRPGKRAVAGCGDGAAAGRLGRGQQESPPRRGSVAVCRVRKRAGDD